MTQGLLKHSLWISFGFFSINLSDLNTRSCISLRSVVVKQMPRISLIFYIINLSFRPSFYHSFYSSSICPSFYHFSHVWGFWMSLFGQTVESRQDIIGRERWNGIWLRSPRVHSIILSFYHLSFYHSIILSFYHSIILISLSANSSSICPLFCSIFHRSFCCSVHLAFFLSF